MRALVLSGGAVHGAYQLGALKYLVNDLNLQYDILCGVSVGALNCAFLSLFPKTQEKQAVDNLDSIWQNLNNAKIYKNWFPLSVIEGLWKDSIYNSQPLIDLVSSTLNLQTIRQSNRQITVGAVNMATGDYKVFTQNDDSFIQGVLASSSYPMGLKPISINNQKYTDGGVKHIVPLQEAIDAGATDIDIIVCGPPQTTDQFSDVDTVSFGLRCFDFMTDQMTQSDLKVAQLYNQLVQVNAIQNKRYLNIQTIRPTKTLEISSLNFDNSTIKQMIEQGYNEAKQQYII